MERIPKLMPPDITVGHWAMLELSETKEGKKTGTHEGTKMRYDTKLI